MHWFEKTLFRILQLFDIRRNRNRNRNSFSTQDCQLHYLWFGRPVIGL